MKKKEKLLHEIFAKSNVDGTELFAVDKEIVVQLLSAFEGTQVYPETQSKEETFDKSSRTWQKEESKRLEKEQESLQGLRKNSTKRIPDGTYYLDRGVRGFGKLEASLEISNGVLTLLAGSDIAPLPENPIPYITKIREKVVIENGKLVEDVIIGKPSEASSLCVGNASNGWTEWKNSRGESLKDLKL